MTDPQSTPFHIGANTLRVRVRLTPRASRNAIIGIRGDALAIAVTAPPVEGAANQVLVRFLAQHLSVPRRSIRIVKGEASRSKLLEIETSMPEAMIARLR